MGKLFAAVLLISPALALIFYYNYMQNEELKIERSVVKEDNSLQRERFNAQFNAASLDFAESEIEKAVLQKDINTSLTNIEKIEVKREQAEKKLKEAKKRSEDAFKDMEIELDEFAGFDKDFETIDEKDFSTF